MGIIMDKKLTGIILAFMLSIILIESYFLFNQPNQNLNLTKDTSDSTSSITSSSPLPSSSFSSNESSKSSNNTGQVNSEVTFIPAIPEFTVAYVDASYDVPTTYSTDSYTGKQVIHEGYHVFRTAIEIKIINQPFTAYTINNGEKIKFYYNVRTKGHFTEEWGEVYEPEEMPIQSESQYTMITYNSDPTYLHSFYLGTTSSMLEVTAGGQVDIQVKALVGIPSEGNIYFPSTFWGKESAWSNTQTLTIP